MRRVRIGLVCSAGGHLDWLWRLAPWWSRHDRFWVTFDKPDARERLAGERVYWAHGPTNRDLPNLVRNLALAPRVLSRERPDLLVSDGAGVALPFFAVGRAMGVPLVYLEVPDRIDRPSLTARLVAPLVDRMVLTDDGQRSLWPDGVVIDR